jgi:hypothetical protein
MKKHIKRRKKLFTSNFNLAGTDKNAIAISVGVPKWYTGKRFMPLAPTWDMVNKYKQGKISDATYTRRYNAILKELDANQIVKEFPSGSILLCWETPGDFCHRRLVANWIKRKTGIEVWELSDKKLEEFFEL